MLKPADAVIHTLPECPSFGQLVPEIPPMADPGRFKAGEAAGWKAGKGGTAQPLPPSDVHSNRPISTSTRLTLQIFRAVNEGQQAVSTTQHCCTVASKQSVTQTQPIPPTRVHVRKHCLTPPRGLKLSISDSTPPTNASEVISPVGSTLTKGWLPKTSYKW